MSLPKRIVIDIGNTLRNYIATVQNILNQDQFLKQDNNRPINNTITLQPSWIEESIRQITDILVDSIMLNNPAGFFNAIQSRPNLMHICGQAYYSLNPDSKIMLEKAWKELAIYIYQHFQYQVPKESTFCNYILLSILDDGLVFGEDQFYG